MKSYKEFLIELTKGEKLGYETKISINKEILDHLKNAEIFEGTPFKNSFTSFVSIKKLGINPRSKFNTPIGIYAYPNEYLKRKIGLSKSTEDNVPYAGDSPFANIFSVKGNIIDLATMTEDDVKKYYDKIVEYWCKLRNCEKESDEYKTVKNVMFYNIAKKAPTEANVKSPAGKFWYVTMMVAGRLKDLLNTNNNAVAWNKLFREIGIDGVVDRGKKIIHKNEPTQAVFFSKSAIAKNKLVENKYSKAERKLKQERGAAIAANKKEISDIFKDKGDAELLKKIKHNPALIEYIKNPSPKIQIAAIKRDPSVISKIKNPTFEVEKYIIDRNMDYYLKNIDNMSEKGQIYAIDKDIKFIYYFKKILPSTINYASTKITKDQFRRMVSSPNYLIYNTYHIITDEEGFAKLKKELEKKYK